MTKSSFKTVHEPAHTDYTITVIRANGEQWEYYTPCVYRTREAAQRECNRLNERQNRRGLAVVASHKRPAGTSYEMTIRL